MGKCKHCDGLGGIEGRWTCDVCGGRGYASSDAEPERDAMETAQKPVAQFAWCIQGTENLKALTEAIAATLRAAEERGFSRGQYAAIPPGKLDTLIQAERERALEECAKIANSQRRNTSMLASNPPQSGAAHDIAAMILALKGKP